MITIVFFFKPRDYISTLNGFYSGFSFFVFLLLFRGCRVKFVYGKMCVKIRISLAEFMRSRTILCRGGDLRTVGTVTVDLLVLRATRGFGRNRSEMVLMKKLIHSAKQHLFVVVFLDCPSHSI